jgi:hypothetical protein
MMQMPGVIPNFEKYIKIIIKISGHRCVLPGHVDTPQHTAYLNLFHIQYYYLIS